MKSLRIISLLTFVMLAFGISASAQVTVNPGGGAFTTLADACNAINAGTHTGVITVEIGANTTEIAACVINSSGAGAASYTSINIFPTVDGVTVSGAGAGGGRGLIELNGADNVTIDGDNPFTVGINRNLTLNNTSIGTYHQVIRVALNTTTVTSADNNAFRNLNLVGGAVGRNISTATSTTGTENTTYGVYVGANASGATTAPTTIASVGTVIGAGATAANLVVDNNTITSVARGVAVQGSATTVAPGLQINNNIIGNPTAGDANGVYSMGITAQGSGNAIIRRNTIYVEWFVGTQNRGIDIGSLSLSITAATIEKNRITRVRNNNTGTFGAYGINLGGGSTHVVRNNFVTDIKHDMTGGGAFSTTFGVFGIRIASGTGHQIYNNSVNLFGTYSGTAASTLLSASLAITGTGLTGIDVRNNILSNTHSSGTTSIAHVSIWLPSGGTSAMNLTLNNNDYRFGTDAARQGAGQAGTTAGTNFFTTFDPTMTTPASNLRSYSNILNAAGNDTLSLSVDPSFNSDTDLHILGTSLVLNLGATIASVTDDIDGDARPLEAVYEIGADERMAAAAPGQIQLSSATYSGNEGTTVIVTATRTLGTSGAVSVDYTTTPGTASEGTCGTNDYVDATGTLSWANAEGGAKTFMITLCTDAVADPAETVNIAISNVMGGATLATPNTAVLTIGDIPPPLSGTYTVGTAGTYPSLTNAGGIFEALNLSGAAGPVTIEITSDLTGETGAIVLNPIAGSPAILIKPTGAPRLITGSSTTAIIRISGADNIRIDGSTAAMFADNVVGGTPALRELTIENTNTGTASGVILVGSGADGAQNNILRNLNVDGNAPTTTIVAISLGGNTVGTPGTDNDNNTVQNCRVRRAQFGIYSAGVSIANPNTGTVIQENQLDATGVDSIGRVGIILFNDNGAQIVENSVGGISSSASADSVGIGLGVGAADAQFSTTATTSGGVTNALVTRNRINGVANDNTWGAAGIAVAGDTGGPNTISNNMITGVISDATSPDIVAGIFVAGVTGSTTRLYYNSISMTGDRGATAGLPSYGIAITGTDPTVELKNNIFYTSQVATGGSADAESYAIGMVTATFVNLDSNFNDFWSTGANDGGFRTGSLAAAAGTDHIDLAAWNTATGDDTIGDSLEVDPMFVDPLTDLHLVGIASPLYDQGTPVSELRDFDNQLRSMVGFAGGVPDIGGDEALAPLAADGSIGGRVMAADGTGIRNAVITITGGNLTQPIVIKSSAFGYYNVDGLELGSTYVVTINSKRFVFANPSVVVSLQESVSELDFQANPQ